MQERMEEGREQPSKQYERSKYRVAEEGKMQPAATGNGQRRVPPNV
jgi:hypothetical protein